MTDRDEGAAVGRPAAPLPETFTPARAVAIHVAGHAVMARIISQPFMPIRIVDGAPSYHELDHGLPAWFTHDDGSAVLGQVTLSKRLMVCLAGTATEAAWLTGCVDVPSGMKEITDLGSTQDQLAARRGTAVTDAFIEYQRQVVLTRTGSAYFPRPTLGDFGDRDIVLRRAFWLTVYEVADAVERAGELTWAKAKAVMNQLEKDDMASTIQTQQRPTQLSVVGRRAASEIRVTIRICRRARGRANRRTVRLSELHNRIYLQRALIIFLIAWRLTPSSRPISDWLTPL